ncbi:MAG: hypothetical protein QG650_378 [Patescibacteria group bacterium]|nr:hypothetical protein [Patescibacteria group bacterium]
MSSNSGNPRFGNAETALLLLALSIVAISPFFPITAHGVLNWYITGFDDLLIFAATYMIAKRRGHSGYAIFGLLLAVSLMIALVAFVGKELSTFAEYAKWSAVIPLWYAGREVYKIWKGHGDEEEKEAWWMKFQMFGRAFFGFSANCLDDIAINTSMLAGAYAGNAGEYLVGVSMGAVSMVVLAAVLGKKIHDYPVLYVLGYLLAAGVIIFL